MTNKREQKLIDILHIILEGQIIMSCELPRIITKKNLLEE